ncbi:MAG: RluA family pseudouridine synthase [Patescibacteria group bacterium]
MKPKFLLPILYEDEYLIAINKPARVATVPGEKISLHESVLGVIQSQCANRGFTPYVLHRLDKDTSGILLFGKYPKDREQLESILTNPATHKKYVALVKGMPQGKVITAPIKARESSEKVFAQTAYKVVAVFRGHVPLCSLVEAEIKTGRKYQVRVHFAHVGHPVILDPKFGDEQFNRKFRIRFRLGRQFLHSVAISFIHPFTQKLTKIEAPLPIDLQSVLNKLQFGQ